MNENNSKLLHKCMATTINTTRTSGNMLEYDGAGVICPHIWVELSWVTSEWRIEMMNHQPHIHLFISAYSLYGKALGAGDWMLALFVFTVFIFFLRSTAGLPQQ